MRKLLRAGFIASLLLSVSACSFAEDLGPGSPAPKLEISKWFKGKPIKGFEANKIYVVEFWATWCGPCKDSIPHLTKMAKENPDVTFIGVDSFEEDKDNIGQKFVDQMGDKMDYNVGYTGNRDHMSETWMMASNQPGIPTAFVVKDSKILWIGHPMSMEKPLAEIKAGKFDLAAFKVQFDKETAATKEQMAQQKALMACTATFTKGDRAEAHKQLDEVVKKYPALAQSAEMTKFQWLAIEDAAKWESNAKALAASKKPEAIRTLLSFSLRQANATGDAFKQGETALKLALDANPNDFLSLQYASSFYSTAKDLKTELMYVKKINELLPTTEYKDQREVVKYWQDHAKELEAKINGSKG